MYKKFERIMRERGFSSVEEIARKYVEEQIKIYDIVIAMGGEPRNHGLYDLACLYWDLDFRDLAVETWAQIDDSYRSDALDSIKEAISWLDDPQKAYTLIDNILNYYATIGVGTRLKRLLDLGKWKARGNALR
jgi:protein-tyrosine-phosphatase